MIISLFKFQLNFHFSVWPEESLPGISKRGIGGRETRDG
jgi:hypothetical protein